MHSINRRFVGYLVLMIAFVFMSSPVWAGDAVSFSGNVKKVIAAKSKVAIKDPATKKRFTVVVNDQSKLKGISGIGDLKKGDAVAGQYVVTDKGLYVVTEMTENNAGNSTGRPFGMAVENFHQFGFVLRPYSQVESDRSFLVVFFDNQGMFPDVLDQVVLRVFEFHPVGQ